ncbi:hypothetical protein CROQUDRAFT_407725 [Cronartium quercuum f. sp. fusiforme G11]|uniref:Uncharacterized protein n=1 Tax=Cronartium quercuum f. sp. fusiforme G11 TaxID=708437 RepID=A0A9P6THF2_9BASI|nr:hypothetical protein CROQUDRAFT_407725 [Cronartium quercuum f. sp. fusiforme G11]
MNPNTMLNAVLLSLCLLSTNARPNPYAGSLGAQNSTGGQYTTSSSTTTSTTTTTSRSYDIHFHRGYSVVLNSYPLGGDGVMCQHRAQPSSVQSTGTLGTPVGYASQNQSPMMMAGVPSRRIKSSSDRSLASQMQVNNGTATNYIPSASQNSYMMTGVPVQKTASFSSGGVLTSQMSTNNGISSSYGAQIASQPQVPYSSNLQSQGGMGSNSYVNGGSNGQVGALSTGPQDLSQSVPYPYSGSSQSYSASSPQSYIVSGYGSGSNNGTYSVRSGSASSIGANGMYYGSGGAAVGTPYSSSYSNPLSATNSSSVGVPAVLNLSPANCQVQCYPSVYQSPNKRDCQHIVRTLSQPGLDSVSIEPNFTFHTEVA